MSSVGQLGLAALYDLLKFLVSALGLALFIVVVRLPSVWWRRRKLFRFLGLTKERTRFTVYLSTVFVVRGGSVDFQGTPRTFHGPAVPAEELAVMDALARPFRDAVLEDLPRRLRGWLARKASWVFRDVTPEFVASPLDPSAVQTGNLLAVGSRFYNSAADVFAQSGRAMLSMEQRGSGMVIRVTRGSDVNRVFQQRTGHNEDLAILEKLSDASTGSTVFVAAGLGVTGTRGAAEYLAHRWQELLSKFGTDTFALCLRFDNVLSDPYAYRRAEELAAYGRP